MISKKRDVSSETEVQTGGQKYRSVRYIFYMTIYLKKQPTFQDSQYS